MKTLLPLAQFYEAQQQVIEGLKAKQEALTQIKSNHYSLIVKWQMMLGVLIPIQIDIIKKLGFTNEQTALIEFNGQLMHYQQQDQKLRDLNTEKWNFIFENAFDMKTVQTISLEQAQNLINDISTEMMSEHFLTQVDQYMRTLDPKLSVIEKRQALLVILLPMQMNIMAKHGFSGEPGYIQAQKAIMDYLHDAKMMGMATQAQIQLFSRAGLMGS